MAVSIYPASLPDRQASAGRSGTRVAVVVAACMALAVGIAVALLSGNVAGMLAVGTV